MRFIYFRVGMNFLFAVHFLVKSFCGHTSFDMQQVSEIETMSFNRNDDCFKCKIALLVKQGKTERPYRFHMHKNGNGKYYTKQKLTQIKVQHTGHRTIDS